jgi:ferredoxin--NADP+ reductase
MMQIVQKKVLAETQDTKITQLEIVAPEIAKEARAGQFVVLMAVAEGERIPLTVVSQDPDKGTIKLILQEVGLTTKLLGRLNIGDSLSALVGPLGHPTEIKYYGRVILIGGGVGIAELYPVAKALKAAGNQLTIILGAKTKDLLLLEEELKAQATAFYKVSDDGSSGRKGFTTDVLAELLEKTEFDLAYAVGPLAMMQKVAALTRDFKLKLIVSLNAVMVDATGMCGSCRVTVGGQNKFSCVDGPDFDGHLVDWDELTKRNRIYQAQEKHICNLLTK